MIDRRPRLGTESYLRYLERDGVALADAAEGHLDADVPGCPGWNVEELVWHTGRVHAFWAAIAREGLRDPRAAVRPERPPTGDLLAWYRANLTRTVEDLAAADPSRQVWTWAGEDVAWIRRRMAHETAVHAWDARSATTSPPPIDPELAADGIEEFLEFFMTETEETEDVAVHIHATDIEGEWLAKLESGTLVVEHRHAKGDVALRGQASNLLLLLWGRVPEAEVEVLGDRAALFRFLEAADLS